MEYQIFYSWQADRPTKTNRGLIREALDKAVKQIDLDDSLIVESDREGVPGSPDILYTILEKIDRADIFVCDVSTVGSSTKGKPIPNPNVIFELGYAMRAKGMQQILMVLNTAYGQIEDLPFDLKRFAAITYNAIETEEPASARNTLAAKLKGAIESIVANIGNAQPVQPVPADLAVQSVEQNTPNADSQVRAFMRWLVKELGSLSPKATLEPPLYSRLEETLSSTKELVVSFARVGQAIATNNHQQAARAILEGFPPILEGYWFSRGQGGRTPDVGFDFYRFIGHEIFVTFIALLMREQRWQIIADLLGRSLSIDSVKMKGGPGAVSYTYISEYVEIGEEWNRSEQGPRSPSWHADMLRDRHSVPPLEGNIPLDLFADADYFLFLRSELKNTGLRPELEWRPWSYMCMGNRVPRFLIDAYNRRFAELLLAPLDINSVEDLRRVPANRFQAAIEMYPQLKLYRSPLDGFSPMQIGSQ